MVVSSFVNSVLVKTYEYLKTQNILVGVPNLLDIARGKIAGARQAQVEGYIEGIINGTRDISELEVNNIPIPDLAGVTMSIVSTSVNDTLLGSGSRKVIVEYIEPITEVLKSVEVELNGTTPVVVPVSIAFESDFYVSDSATMDTTSAGDITIFNGGTVYNIIKEGGNKSLKLMRYIPKNKDFYISELSVSGNSKEVSIRLRANLSDNLTSLNTFIFRSVIVSADGSSELTFNPPIVITGGHYIKASIYSGSVDNAGIVSIGINGHLENKSSRSTN